MGLNAVALTTNDYIGGKVALAYCIKCMKTTVHKRFKHINWCADSEYYCGECGWIWQSQKHRKFPHTIHEWRKLKPYLRSSWAYKKRVLKNV